jgi:hypothetical protein
VGEIVGALGQAEPFEQAADGGPAASTQHAVSVQSRATSLVAIAKGFSNGSISGDYIDEKADTIWCVWWVAMPASSHKM